MSAQGGHEDNTGKTLLEALNEESAARAVRKKAADDRPAKRGLMRLSAKQKKFAIFGLAVVILIAALTVVAMRSGTSYYLTVKQMLAKGNSIYGERLRISGFVEDGTIESDPGRMIVRFIVRDKKGGAQTPVSYRGVVPDNFGNSVEVVLDGAYDGSVFAADNMLTKCPSKYKAAKD